MRVAGAGAVEGEAGAGTLMPSCTPTTNTICAQGSGSIRGCDVMSSASHPVKRHNMPLWTASSKCYEQKLCLWILGNCNPKSLDCMGSSGAHTCTDGMQLEEDTVWKAGKHCTHLPAGCATSAMMCRLFQKD